MQYKLFQKEQIQKTAEATGDLIGNKIADKIANSSKKSKNLGSKELNSKELQSKETNNEIPKERYISPQERQQIIDKLRLI